MRFLTILKIYSNEKVKHIPSDYRRGLVSLLKEAIQKEDFKFFLEYYKPEKKNTPKPFTFSTFIPNVVSKDKSLSFSSDIIKLNFSTNDIEFFTKTYNGLLKIVEFPFYSYKIKIEKIFYEKPYIIKENRIKFKTLSPVLLRDHENYNRLYLLPNNPKYSEQLKYSIFSIAKRFLGIENFEINIQILSYKPVYFFHYRELIQGADMILIIETLPKILQLLYDIGIGSRRSEGFGMLKVV